MKLLTGLLFCLFMVSCQMMSSPVQEGSQTSSVTSTSPVGGKPVAELAKEQWHKKQLPQKQTALKSGAHQRGPSSLSSLDTAKIVPSKAGTAKTDLNPSAPVKSLPATSLPATSVGHKLAPQSGSKKMGGLGGDKVTGNVKKEKSLTTYSPIPIDDNEHVDKWINYFQTAGRDRMELYLGRSTRYLNMMKGVLREHGLPENLVWTAMIESGFSPYAHSSANAVGYWQFIAETGRRYGLKVNSYVDDRRDPVLSTHAAARYFKDLYNVFTSWPLALASYNAGEYRVMNRAVMRYYTKDFWFLSSKRAFPRETANYVPKFMAAFRISADPEQYGFDQVQYQQPLQYDTVKLTFPISLKKLAKGLNIPHKDLKMLNPRYRGDYVPLDEEPVQIRVPVGASAGIAPLLATAYMKKPKFLYANHYWYRIKRGDTLSQLARRNKTTVSTIRRMNKMGRRSSLLRAGRKIKLPYYNKKRSVNEGGLMAHSHIVQRGESLSSIASKYKVTVSKLKKINGLSARGVIHPGQTLNLVQGVRSLASVTNLGQTIHIVKRGETLIGIAKKYKVSLPVLMKQNSLKWTSILVAGRQIVIPK